MNRNLVSLLFTIGMIAFLSLLPKTVNANSFNDVDLYEAEINFLATSQVIKGYPDGSFKPNNPVTRLQAVQMILNEMGVDITNTTNPGFSDMKPGDYGYEEVAKAVELGFIRGKPDGSFDPFTPLTRGQMAVILVNAYQLDGEYGGEFDDIPADDPKREYVQKLAANNITNGYGNNTFKLSANISRAHFAVFMAKLLDDSFKTPVVGNYHGNISNGANFAVKGDWTFYGDVGIWKYNRDQSDIIRLADDQSSNVIFLNVVRNQLYYVNAADNFSIYRMKTDGSNKERIVKGQAYELQLYNDWLYYYSRDDQAIYKAKMDGTDTRLLVDGNGSDLTFIVDAGKIYFSDKNGIYQLDLDGKNKKQLIDGVDALSLIHADQSIFYLNESDGRTIYRVNDDGTGNEQVIATPAQSYNYLNGVIYYADYQDGTMFKYFLSTSKETQLSDQNYRVFPMILDNLIYHFGYNESDETYQWYTMDLNGESYQQIPITIDFE
ncbi:S-layer homology domain-containing protein [Aquibacillus salsiterrae]|uniref:S-layer homology domain-containing protein n=1 Tax=Aquibacillus salsiterrae TaxID=2950439 RepID=A0A9X3WD96_9BACI|nr:S-layer homology domain-containing protein [Aquibacillus salsiterrae]MDC3415950.1 S-layer homology domain-containing protein [Aquibacillus salsiterrae]